jgi:hypothetical protein
MRAVLERSPVTRRVATSPSPLGDGKLCFEDHTHYRSVGASGAIACGSTAARRTPCSCSEIVEAVDDREIVLSLPLVTADSDDEENAVTLSWSLNRSSEMILCADSDEARCSCFFGLPAQSHDPQNLTIRLMPSDSGPRERGNNAAGVKVGVAPQNFSFSFPAEDVLG